MFSQRLLVGVGTGEQAAVGRARDLQQAPVGRVDDVLQHAHGQAARVQRARHRAAAIVRQQRQQNRQRLGAHHLHAHMKPSYHTSTTTPQTDCPQSAFDAAWAHFACRRAEDPAAAAHRRAQRTGGVRSEQVNQKGGLLQQDGIARVDVCLHVVQLCDCHIRWGT